MVNERNERSLEPEPSHLSGYLCLYNCGQLSAGGVLQREASVIRNVFEATHPLFCFFLRHIDSENITLKVLPYFFFKFNLCLV